MTLIIEEDPNIPVDRPLHRPSDPIRTALECWQTNVKQRDLKEEVLDYWRETVNATGTGRPVGTIIAPLAPFVAPPHGTNRNTTYTTGWNLLDYAAITTPVDKVDPVLDPKQTRDSFYNDRDRENWETCDPVNFENAQISVQIVARTPEEEALIGMSKIVDEALKALEEAKL